MRVLASSPAGRRLQVALLWEPRDLWVGAYWTRRRFPGGYLLLDVYLSALPCLPVRVQWTSTPRLGHDADWDMALAERGR